MPKGKCSICESKNVYYGKTDLDITRYGYEITCEDCGAEGWEWYDLEYNETIMKKVREEDNG